MSNDLKYISTEDLVDRWNSIINDYYLSVKTLKEAYMRYNNFSRELNLIREELIKRKTDLSILEDEFSVKQTDG